MRIVNTYVLTVPAQGSIAGAALMAVLTMGAVEDYAVYEGIVNNDTPRDVNGAWVGQHGLKCSFERAITYFPHIPREQYRD